MELHQYPVLRSGEEGRRTLKESQPLPLAHSHSRLVERLAGPTPSPAVREAGAVLSKPFSAAVLCRGPRHCLYLLSFLPALQLGPKCQDEWALGVSPWSEATPTGSSLSN